jgi:hypothetical protein
MATPLRRESTENTGMARVALWLPGSQPAHPARLSPAQWLLGALAVSTMAGTLLLTLSVLALRPARVDLASWLGAAAVFIGQGLLTLAAMSGRLRGRIVRAFLLIGGAAIAWLGGSWAYGTVSGSHFEGHALVLGTALALQGALTTWIAVGGE